MATINYPNPSLNEIQNQEPADASVFNRPATENKANYDTIKTTVEKGTFDWSLHSGPAQGLTVRNITPNGQGTGADENPTSWPDNLDILQPTYGQKIDPYSQGMTGYDNTSSFDLISSNRSLVIGSWTLGIIYWRWKNDPKIGVNTDSNGTIWSEHTVSGDFLTINLYKEKPVEGVYDSSQLVATGSFDKSSLGQTDITTVDLNEANSSGLNVQVVYRGNAVPSYLDQKVATYTYDYQGVNAGGSKAYAMFSFGELLSGIRFESVATGFAANDISIEFVKHDTDGVATDVVVDGNFITVRLETSGGEIVATADDVLVQIGSNPEPFALIRAIQEYDIAGGIIPDQLVEERERTYLTGGMDAGKGWTLSDKAEAFDRIAVSGVEVGVNTSPNGELFVSFVNDDPGSKDTYNNMYVYKNALKREEDLVASFTGYPGTMGTIEGNIDDSNTFYLNDRNDSGLQMAVLTSSVAYSGGYLQGTTDVELTMTANLNAPETLVANDGYMLDSSGSAFTVKLPASPSNGDRIAFVDVASSLETNNVTLDRNGNTIQGIAEDLTLDVNDASFYLVFNSNNSDWRIYN